MISKLRKLRGRSLGELVDRGRRKALDLSERAGVSSTLTLPTDETFLRQFRGSELAAKKDLLAFFRRPRHGRFFASFEDKDATIAAFMQKFSQQADLLIERADRICSGSFDLLGYKDLNFGAAMPDWHFEPIAGVRSPMVHRSRFSETDSKLTGDKKIVWELNRHQYFSILGRAYWLTGDERYAATIVSHLEDWIDKNPPQMGVNWVSSLEVAFRSISWIWAFNFIRDSQSLTDEILFRFLKVLSFNASHIEQNLSTYTSPNTHLTGEALGLYILGSFFSEHRLGHPWKARGYQVMLEALKFQIRRDGGYVEQSTQYQRYTTDFYLCLILLRRREEAEVDPLVENSVRKLLEFLMYVTQPNGETPLIGDDDGGRLHFPNEGEFADFRATLALGAAVFEDPHLKFVAGEANGELLWLGGPELIEKYDSISAEPPSDTQMQFARSGVFTVRTGWEKDASYLLADCGEHGFLNGGHAHADALGFVLSAKGIPVFIDPGTYNYTADSGARDLYRSTNSHNCLTVNGSSSSEPCGPFSWKSVASARVECWTEDAKGVVLAGTHDGFGRFGVDYKREFRISPAFRIEILDSLETKTANLFQINLILHPSVYAEIESPFRFSCFAKAGSLKLLTVVTMWTDGEEIDVSGWAVEPFQVSPQYGALIESSKLVMSVRSDRNFWIRNEITIAN